MQKPMPPVHPGEILNEEFLKPLGLSQTRLALDTGMPQSRVHEIIAGNRGISADTAIRLGAYFGNSPRFWLNCQNTYELDMARYTGKLDEIVARVHSHVSSTGALTAPQLP